VTSLQVDQFIVRTPGGIDGLEKIISENWKTLTAVEFICGTQYWRSIDYPVPTTYKSQATLNMYASTERNCSLVNIEDESMQIIATSTTKGL
jgi:hypothetical protein